MRPNLSALALVSLSLLFAACDGGGDGGSKKEDGESKDGKESKTEYARIREIVVSYVGARGADPSVVRTKEDARKLAEELVAKAKEPLPGFPELAWDFSDHQSWKAGGERGRVNDKDDPGAVPKEVVQAALDLEVGSVAGPIELPDGFHIVKRIPLEGDKQGSNLIQQDLAHIQCASEDEAKMVLGLAREGKLSWDTLVRQYSRDPVSRDREGRMLRYRRSKYGREFETMVKGLRPGDLAPEVLKSGQGFHVVKKLPPE